MGIGYLGLVAVLLGHGILWIGMINRLHALPISRPVLHAWDKVFLLILGGVPLGAAIILVQDPTVPARWRSLASEYPPVAAYAGVCTILACVGVIIWVSRKCRRSPQSLFSCHARQIDVAAALGEKPIGSPLIALLDRVPRHDMFQLQIAEKTLMLPRLPAELDGLTIVHLSDLHFCGRITRPYFEFVIDRANELDADIVAVTGDLVDTPECVAWMPETLGRLRAAEGVYFILGNHDKRLRDTGPLRQTLTELGLRDLGGRWIARELLGVTVELAGSEWPWFGPRPQAPHAEACSPAEDPFRILLSHSPDQIRWARRHHFDLMLAGHTHGGQVRLPVIGPVFAPSLYGVRYAGGVFDEPPTLMHVSRGISGLEALRYRCPPELARLVLRRAVHGDPERADDEGGRRLAVTQRNG